MTIFSERWSNVYMNIAESIAAASKDGSSKCGAVLIRPDKTIASLGFNGFPKRLVDNDEYLTNPEMRAKKYERIVHAEINCINHCREYDLIGYHMFITKHPCSVCALRIASTGIASVTYKEDILLEERWKESLDVSKEILSEAGIKLLRFLSYVGNA